MEVASSEGYLVDSVLPRMFCLCGAMHCIYNALHELNPLSTAWVVTVDKTVAIVIFSITAFLFAFFRFGARSTAISTAIVVDGHGRG